MCDLMNSLHITLKQRDTITIVKAIEDNRRADTTPFLSKIVYPAKTELKSLQDVILWTNSIWNVPDASSV